MQYMYMHVACKLIADEALYHYLSEIALRTTSCSYRPISNLRSIREMTEVNRKGVEPELGEMLSALTEITDP